MRYLLTVLFFSALLTPALLGSSGPIATAFGPIPTERPLIFGEGRICLGHHEHHLTLSPEGDELFFVVADRNRLFHVIIWLRFNHGKWTPPQIAPFSGEYSDFAPVFHPSGEYMLFCSNRPIPGEQAGRKDFNIWQVRREGGKWGVPSVLSQSINDQSNEYNPSLSLEGDLYFQDHDASGVDIYCSRFVNGAWQAAQKLPSPVNSKYGEIGPWISADGEMLLFSSDRPGGLGHMDFYVSYRSKTGDWTSPKNLGPQINTPSFDAIITMSPAEDILFFSNFMGPNPKDMRGRSYERLKAILSSALNGHGTILWLSASSLKLRE